MDGPLRVPGGRRDSVCIPAGIETMDMVILLTHLSDFVEQRVSFRGGIATFATMILRDDISPVAMGSASRARCS